MQGKVILVVNVASQCGFTPQYKDLAELDSRYRSKGLVILGFPCNQVGHICISCDRSAATALPKAANASLLRYLAETLSQHPSSQTPLHKAMLLTEIVYSMALRMCFLEARSAVLQFGGQEPGSNAEVKKFAQARGAKFPIMAKVDVNGSNGELML